MKIYSNSTYCTSGQCRHEDFKITSEIFEITVLPLSVVTSEKSCVPLPLLVTAPKHEKLLLFFLFPFLCQSSLCVIEIENQPVLQQVTLANPWTHARCSSPKIYGWVSRQTYCSRQIVLLGCARGCRKQTSHPQLTYLHYVFWVCVVAQLKAVSSE